VNYRKPKDPHCWVYVPTDKWELGEHLPQPIGFVGLIFEVPNFRAETQVAYCPHGKTNCYEV
jgi:hypothetical protein